MKKPAIPTKTVSAGAPVPEPELPKRKPLYVVVYMERTDDGWDDDWNWCYDSEGDAGRIARDKASSGCRDVRIVKIVF